MSFFVTRFSELRGFCPGWFCMKYVWPPITSALEKRKKTIADGLAAAEKGQQSLENRIPDILANLDKS